MKLWLVRGGISWQFIVRAETAADAVEFIAQEYPWRRDYGWTVCEITTEGEPGIIADLIAI